MEHVKYILSGLGALVALAMVLAAIAIPALASGMANTHKVEKLTAACISHGYAGWSDDRGCYH